MSVDVEKGKALLIRMAVAQGLFLFPGVGFAFGYFRMGVAWMLWAFVGCLGAALATQLWFIGRILRISKGA